MTSATTRSPRPANVGLVPVPGSLQRALDGVAAAHAADQAALGDLAVALKQALPNGQVSVQRRGVPIIGSRVVGLRAVAGGHVFRVDTSAGVPVCEIGAAINGVATSHVRVTPQEWVGRLRAALTDSTGGGLGGALR